MPTIRSQFSFQQFEQVLQKLAHKIALNAVRTLAPERVRIIIRSNGTFSEVDTKNYQIKFYARHASYVEKGGHHYENWWGFDVEEKTYVTSNHCTKISFASSDEKHEQKEKKIVKFINKVMAKSKLTPAPRFTLTTYKGGQRYLDLIDKTAQ